mmetsp:Transcript_12592/g.34411  ORF Transcript_12592/g.34411 Transcript_12592/m.34411 type:complete len:102 (+) Transcript_12592:146-451(+)
MLQEYVSLKPKTLLMLFGPRNCGKSAIVSSMLEGPLKDNAVLLDCRAIGTATPERFARGAVSAGLPKALRSKDGIKAAFDQKFKTLQGFDRTQFVNTIGEG